MRAAPAALDEKPAELDERATLLPADLRAPGAARRFLRVALPGVSEETLQTALLLVSELVSNAVKHGTGPVRLSVSSLPDGSPVRVRIGVVDDDPRPPTLRGALNGSFLQESGRGVLLLDALATHWGVASEPPGKQVWFELEIRP